MVRQNVQQPLWKYLLSLIRQCWKQCCLISLWKLFLNYFLFMVKSIAVSVWQQSAEQSRQMHLSVMQVQTVADGHTHTVYLSAHMHTGRDEVWDMHDSAEACTLSHDLLSLSFISSLQSLSLSQHDPPLSVSLASLEISLSLRL